MPWNPLNPSKKCSVYPLRVRAATASEEHFAAQMSPHVNHLHSLIGKRWPQVKYGATAAKILPYTVRRTQPLDPGDQALWSCEVYALLTAFDAVPSQEDAAGGDLSDFVSDLEARLPALQELEIRLPNISRCRGPASTTHTRITLPTRR